MSRQRPLRVDPIAEAKRQWEDHGWASAAPGMAAVSSIMRVHQLMLARVEAQLKPFNLSFARYELLRLLAFSRDKRMPMASVVSRLQVHPASVTGVVNRLVESGLVERAPDPADGRATLLVLTSAGEQLADRATVVLNDEVFDTPGMSDEDTTALVGILARFRKEAGDFQDPRPLPAPLELD